MTFFDHSLQKSPDSITEMQSWSCLEGRVLAYINAYCTLDAMRNEQWAAIYSIRTQQMRMDWNELKWIQIFRNIDSRMLKWMFFNAWMHFYSFIGIGAYLYTFQSKNNISFFCALWILFNSKFWIANAVFQFNCIQLNSIESNYIQKKYSLFKIYAFE